MSTNDVPGARPENRDELAMGCWAEHEDGSLILVESTEDGRVIFNIFDVSRQPVMEFRDAMNEGAFKREFSWQPSDGVTKDRWTWHDKTPFPWQRVIASGARAGTRYADVEDQLNAAERIRRRRELHAGRAVDPEEIAARFDQLGERAEGIIARLQRAISRLPGGGDTPRKRRGR